MTLTLSYGRFELPDTDHDAFASAREGFWDPELQPFLDAVPPGSTAIDVGAHVGLYTVYLAKRGVNVIALEAHPAYHDYLRENVRTNLGKLLHVGTVTRLRVMAYSRATALEEVREHRTPASNTWAPVPGRTGEVWGHPLDDLQLDLDIRGPVSLIKVDAQGADLHVLLGAEKLIDQHHPRILIEYEAPLAAQHGHTAEDYRAWIAAKHYEEHSINGWNACLTWRG